MFQSRQRIIVYVLGIIIMTFGIALTIRSLMGTSPFDALLVGLFQTFGLTIGSWEIVVGLALVLFNAAAQRRKPEYFALLTSLITGMGIDLWLFVLGDLISPITLFGQSACLILGVGFVGLGVAVNLQANFAPNPMDRAMLVINELTGLNVAISRALVSLVLVILAFIFSGPIGIGTLFSALITGVFIKFFMHYTARLNKDMNTILRA
ncbi:YczE/YyaS/YitT family protein [Desulfosporosinus shakirovi]|uniref:YczE/YyaS/YitT family protein n=1 Tax=Desulfosporosinus shakirovi TaxID=2885154 RepID=UPI001E3A7EAE|nr:YitT family protein [Desulfosporosinus sp. SRJS8]MCB8818568.1 YitT family protein [Desulfosporosinus sp. SRJS8]